MRLVHVPEEKSSQTTVRWPSDSRRLARFEPINPAPPVMRMRTIHLCSNPIEAANVKIWQAGLRHDLSFCLLSQSFLHLSFTGHEHFSHRDECEICGLILLKSILQRRPK